MENIGLKELKPIHARIIKHLKKNGPKTRNQLVEGMGIPRTTLYDNLERLRNLNLVKKFSRQVNHRGRPVVFWKCEI